MKPPQAELISNRRRLYEPQRNDQHKLYSLHAPEVECSSKGKAHKGYEFGCKVSIVTTSKAGWVIGSAAMHGKPYAGARLKPALKQVEELTAVQPKEAFVDKGYGGREHHPEGV